MQNINGWLMALSFLAGLAVTFALTIRKVTREVPVTHTVSAAARGAVAAGTTAAAAGSAEAGSGSAIRSLVGDEVQADPYGSGSIRTQASATVPAAHSGYTIKGNEDSMLYHTTDSPSYGQTIAEVWFADEESAQRAGFARWDSRRKAAKGSAKVATLASVEEVAPGPYGKGSAAPKADGSGPTGWTIKGNADSMLYHPADSPAYEQTIAEVWFFDEATAKAAGFDKWDKNFR